MKEVKNMYIVENECLEEIIKNIIEYINELERITKDKDKTFFFSNTNKFNKIINKVVKIGECLSKVSAETKNKYLNINWNINKDNLKCYLN